MGVNQVLMFKKQSIILLVILDFIHHGHMVMKFGDVVWCIYFHICVVGMQKI